MSVMAIRHHVWDDRHWRVLAESGLASLGELRVGADISVGVVTRQFVNPKRSFGARPGPLRASTSAQQIHATGKSFVFKPPVSLRDSWIMQLRGARTVARHYDRAEPGGPVAMEPGVRFDGNPRLGGFLVVMPPGGKTDSQTSPPIILGLRPDGTGWTPVYFAIDLGGRKIRVNSVHPGPIDTDMIAFRTPEQREARMQQVPMRRYGTPKEVAQLVAFLLSDESSYITGAEIAIDGASSA
jgi:hypothetical protein